MELMSKEGGNWMDVATCVCVCVASNLAIIECKES